MIGTLLTLWRAGGLAKYAELAAVALAVFFVGFAAGQTYTTQKAVTAAVRVVDARAASEQAASTQALFEWGKRLEAGAHREAKKAQAADDRAHAITVAANREADRTTSAALTQLKKEKEITDGLRKTNAILANMVPKDVDCTFSGDTRVLLDDAAGSSGAGDRRSDTGAAGAATSGAPSQASGSTTTDPAQLTCDQLLRGYVALGAHDRQVMGLLEAFQAWVAERYSSE